MNRLHRGRKRTTSKTITASEKESAAYSKGDEVDQRLSKKGKSFVKETDCLKWRWIRMR